MADEWTPGPWDWSEIDPEDPEWGACEVWPKDDRTSDAKPVATMVCGVANARIIAASPEMVRFVRMVAGISLLDAQAASNTAARDWQGKALFAVGDVRAARALLARIEGGDDAE